MRYGTYQHNSFINEKEEVVKKYISKLKIY